MEILNIELEEKIDTTIRIVHTDEKTNLPIDITGWTAVMQIRSDFGDDNIIYQLTSGSGTIILGGVAGTVDLVFTPAITDQTAVPVAWQRAAYDLVLTDTLAKRTKIRKGFVTIARSATL